MIRRAAYGVGMAVALLGAAPAAAGTTMTPGKRPAPMRPATMAPAMAPAMAPGMAPGMAPAMAPGGTQPAPPPPAELKPGWTPHAGAQIDLAGKKKIYVGDVFRVRVTVIARAEVAVNLPTSVDLGDFSVLGQVSERTEQLDGRKVKRVFVIRVAAYNVGELELPPIPVTFVPPRQAFKNADRLQVMPARTVLTKPVRQRISSVLANEPHPQLKKNAPPVSILVEDRRMKTVGLVLAGVLLGAALGLLLYWLWRRRRRRAKPLPPPRPAHEIALEKLTAIREAAYLERGEFKPYYFGVSEAIREYFGNRYGFDSLELTTTELMEELAKVELMGVARDDVQRFLMDTDLVKFARYIPPLDDARQIFHEAERFVQQTMWIAPVEEDEEETPAAADGQPPAAPPPQKPASEEAPRGA